MATLFFGMNQSLDGYVDHDAMGAPGPELFQHFVEQTRGLTASVYGRGLYELMRYWDDDQPGWTDAEHAFAKAWRETPKWVASRTLTAVGPNATLIEGDVEAAVRRLKAEHDGEIEVGGTVLAHRLAGLIDEYRIYLRPDVVGAGKPFFAGQPPPLRLASHDVIGEAIRLCYVPA